MGIQFEAGRGFIERSAGSAASGGAGLLNVPALESPAGSNRNGFFLVLSRMPTTLTLKNIPDSVYERLKLSAQAHRRSLNSEAIVCLEAVLMPARVPAADRLARARALRQGLPPQAFLARDIQAMKTLGRP
jgi:antitoxin FitA